MRTVESSMASMKKSSIETEDLSLEEVWEEVTTPGA
jgi:hypothetical protein